MTTGTRSPRLAVPPTVPSPLTPAAESAQLLRAIAVAEVGIRQPFRRPPRQREEATTRTVAIPSAEAVTVVDIQPATPRGGLSPTQEEEAHSSESTCQPASLHSILMLDDDDDDGEEQASEEAVEIIRFEPQPAGAKGSFHYLRPDLSGASGLSIHHFEAHGRSVSSSSTETLVDFSKPGPIGGGGGRGTPPDTRGVQEAARRTEPDDAQPFRFGSDWTCAAASAPRRVVRAATAFIPLPLGARRSSSLPSCSPRESQPARFRLPLAGKPLPAPHQCRLTEPPPLRAEVAAKTCRDGGARPPHRAHPDRSRRAQRPSLVPARRLL